MKLLASSAYVVNACFFLLNVGLYYASFIFARRANRRIAAVVRQVRSEVGQDNVVELVPARRAGE